MPLSNTFSGILSLMSLYIIIANSVIVKFLYDIRKKDECKGTPMFTLVYDYYILEFSVALTVLLLSSVVAYNLPMSQNISKMFTPMLSSLLKTKHLTNVLMAFIFVMNCIIFYVLYELNSKKICSEIHPYLLHYLMYSISSGIMGIAYYGVLHFAR